MCVYLFYPSVVHSCSRISARAHQEGDELIMEERIEKLRKQIEYEERKLDACGYGSSDLQYLEGLYAELESLESEEE